MVKSILARFVATPSMFKDAPNKKISFFKTHDLENWTELKKIFCFINSPFDLFSSCIDILASIFQNFTELIHLFPYKWWTVLWLWQFFGLYLKKERNLQFFALFMTKHER